MKRLKRLLSVRGELGRTDFLVGIIGIYLLVTAALYVLNGGILVDIQPTTWLVSKSLSELFIILLWLPLIIRRLRDLGWPVYWALIMLVPWSTSFRHVILYDIHFDDGMADAGVPLLWAGFFSLVAAFLLLIILALKKGRLDQIASKEPPSGGPVP